MKYFDNIILVNQHLSFKFHSNFYEKLWYFSDRCIFNSCWTQLLTSWPRSITIKISLFNHAWRYSNEPATRCGHWSRWYFSISFVWNPLRADDQDRNSWLYCCWGETNNAIQSLDGIDTSLNLGSYQLIRYQYLVLILKLRVGLNIKKRRDL